MNLGARCPFCPHDISVTCYACFDWTPQQFTLAWNLYNEAMNRILSTVKNLHESETPWAV